MIERDYILRMFKLLGQALTRILFFKEIKEYDKALAEIDNGAQTIFGLNIEMLELMPIAGLKDILGADRTLLQSKFYTAATLLKEKGEILELQKKEDESVSLYLRSLHLFMAEASAFEDLDDKRGTETIDFVVNKLKEYDLPVELKQRLAVYYEKLGRFDKLDDVIFEIIEEDAGFVQDGILFYERLLLKSDSELEEGHLPRNEVKQGLADLQNRIAAGM
jgi:Family of unknown function (DUF6483)